MKTWVWSYERCRSPGPGSGRLVNNLAAAAGNQTLRL